MNTFGTIVRLTTFGESHGPAMGGVLEGIPSMLHIDMEGIRRLLERRRPGSRPDVSQRNESDEPEILSGVSTEGVTLGSPIGFIVRNRDSRSEDYAGYSGRFRPNHADFTYWRKYGIHDFRGGGRASARDTVSWTIAGAICMQWLDKFGIKIESETNISEDVQQIAQSGDSIGGIVSCSITNLPVGIGEPVFDKLQSRLAAAMLSINAVKGFEYGDGFHSASMRGSESLDIFERVCDETDAEETSDPFRLASNHCGGIQGGISNGMPVEFRVAFKPTPTLMRPVETLDTEGNRCTIPPKGRHDPCVAIRGAAVVEAMAALVVADLMRIAGYR